MELQKHCSVTNPKEILIQVLKQELEGVVLAPSPTIVIVVVRVIAFFPQTTSPQTFPPLPSCSLIFRRTTIKLLNSTWYKTSRSKLFEASQPFDYTFRHRAYLCTPVISWQRASLNTIIRRKYACKLFDLYTEPSDTMRYDGKSENVTRRIRKKTGLGFRPLGRCRPP